LAGHTAFLTDVPYEVSVRELAAQGLGVAIRKLFIPPALLEMVGVGGPE
jgi:hypothetical protein